MVDRYTRCVLTVIAGALVVLVLQNASLDVNAQGSACGDALYNPCYVTGSVEIDGSVMVDGPLEVYQQ